MEGDFLYLSDRAISFKDFKSTYNDLKMLFLPHQAIFLRSQNLLSFYAAILAAKDLSISLYVCPFTMNDKQVKDLAIKYHGAIFLDDGKIESFGMHKGNVNPCIGIFTSGTTGEPKIALHRWESIESSSKFVPKDLFNQTWLLSYAPWGYAGLQVFFSAWNSQGRLYYRAEQIKEVCTDIIKHGVSIISATPTFWKMLISAWPQGLKVPTLQQATLGGEIVEQSVIDLIASFFHPLRLTHIYASTEAGSAIVVSDRLAGFPLELLEKTTKSGSKFRIRDDELQINSTVGMENYVNHPSIKNEEWIKTGDLVQIRNDRVYFLGRTDGRINSGGRKVCPEEIEQVINNLDYVKDCLVYEKKSPIVGNLIMADLVMKEDTPFNPAEIKQQLKKQLEDYKIPSVIRRVDHLEVSSTGKKIRT